MGSSSDIDPAEELDLFSFPLTGCSLIEASAGTGKTYSLAFLYLRLLLGIGESGDERVKPLSVQNILVVTFTKAATEELRYRIRQNIYQLRMACTLGDHPDSNYKHLLDLIDDKDLAATRLLYAEQSMDEAAIFTIHSFCQRILTTYAFESGSLFKKTLVNDESQLYLQQVSDFWREYFTPMPEAIAAIIWQCWYDPEALLAAIYPYINRELPSNIVTTSIPLFDKILAFHQTNIDQITAVKARWLEHVADIENIIVRSGVSKRSYTKSNLPRWIDRVSQWASEPTEDYHIPDELIKFSQTELNSKTDDDKNAPAHDVFNDIEHLLSISMNLSDAILFDIVLDVRQRIQKEKAALAQMGFDDLLNDLHQALLSHNGLFLANQISAQYPVAMIDEFQDTDPIQYQIFNRVYAKQKNTLLLFIGDPKQAIYGFRGADIFTYIKAKLAVNYQFTMTTNWRSTPDMVDAVNGLFTLSSNPFIYKQIPFIAMNSAESNKEKAFIVDGQRISALNCYLLPENITSSQDYIDYAAEYCAQQISHWLSAKSYFINGEISEKAISSSDIAILVRTGREAEIIQQKLKKRRIKSVYVSNHQSVFESLEAREILRILQAVLTPTHEGNLRSALATRLIGASMAEIDNLSFDPDALEKLVEEFREYQIIWLRYGVLVMLRRLMNHRHLAENILCLDDGERIITNFMHLGELLQESAQEFDTPHALLRWLVKQINSPDQNAINHEQRLESDENLINIITIHKSKGLEYPIVFLPFIGLHRESTSLIYHDPDTYETQYAYQLSTETKELIYQERLAEDLRLLYVALTRSIYHCSFALAGLKRGKSKRLSLNQSAIGYLLLDSENDDYATLHAQLTALKHTHVTDIQLPISASMIDQSNPELSQYHANTFHRKLDQTWRVTSYSGLQYASSYESNQSAHFMGDILPAFDNEVLDDVSKISDDTLLLESPDGEDLPLYDIHHFPKGAIVGTLLHESFEKMDFVQPNTSRVTEQLIMKLNLDEKWQQPMMEWFNSVLISPLTSGLSLSQLSFSQRLNELQFYLPIRNQVEAIKLDHLCKQYDELSRQCESLSFSTVQGMLKGFIDMIFEWQGKYYIVDYKSNYLGESEQAYTQDAMAKAMCEHRYDLQYQLYTLALHRYLQTRIPDYQYETHVGGVYYLFLRGMQVSNEYHGVFYTKPDGQFIKQLDMLFG